MQRCQLYTFEEELPQTLHQWDIPDRAFLMTYHNLHIQHLKRSSLDGSLWSETCRADICALINNQCCYIVYLVGMYIYCKNDTWTFQYQALLDVYLVQPEISFTSSSVVQGISDH